MDENVASHVYSIATLLYFPIHTKFPGLSMRFVQVVDSMQKDVEAHVSNYPNVPSKLICILHGVTLQVIYSSFAVSHIVHHGQLRSQVLKEFFLFILYSDPDTNEVNAQMTLQPVNRKVSTIIL